MGTREQKRYTQRRELKHYVDMQTSTQCFYSVEEWDGIVRELPFGNWLVKLFKMLLV